MDSLEYSNEALEAKGLFYNRKKTVYVEGDDDVVFWDSIFYGAKVEAYIEEVGGRYELDKYIDKVVSGEASFFIAMDNDHSDFDFKSVDHVQIIRTYGYSIENSMYHHSNLNDIVRKFCRRQQDFEEDILDWMKEFSDNFYELLIYDIANHIYKKGIRVFGDNCARFLKTNSSIKVSKKKVVNFIDEISNSFSKNEITKVKRLLSKSKKENWFHIKGHFLTLGVVNFVKHIVQVKCGYKCNISYDSLYALTVDNSNAISDRVDLVSVVKRIERIKAA